MLTAMGVSIDTLSMNNMRYVTIKDQDSITVIKELSGQFSLNANKNSVQLNAKNLVASVDQYPAIQANEIKVASARDSFYFSAWTTCGGEKVHLMDGYIYP